MVRGPAVEPAHMDNCPIGYLYRAGIYSIAWSARASIVRGTAHS